MKCHEILLLNEGNGVDVDRDKCRSGCVRGKRWNGRADYHT
uniref:Uncharacterized protein n=1 Tax=Pseudomonas fluorescens TaxID=294 RepID=A0A060AEU8_PSEFL|nr:hypothetical protein [Pseudomonas fluorescens]